MSNSSVSAAVPVGAGFFGFDLVELLADAKAIIPQLRTNIKLAKDFLDQVDDVLSRFQAPAPEILASQSAAATAELDARLDSSDLSAEEKDRVRGKFLDILAKYGPAVAKIILALLLKTPL